MENIKIIVDNVIEDETGAGGLWDLAREMAIQALSYPDGDEDLNNAIDETQERFYNTLLDYAKYTNTEHYSNKEANARKAFLDIIDKEYEAFKKSKLTLSKEEIYDDAYEIYFYEEVRSYLQDTELTEEGYKLLFKGGTNVLYRLWGKFLEWSYTSVQTYEHIERLVHDYIRYISE